MHFKKFVDVGRIGTRTFGNALLAAMFQKIGIGTFFFGHGRNNGQLAVKKIVIKTGSRNLVFHFSDTRHHAENTAHTAQFFHLLELFGQIAQVEFALLHFFGKCGCFFLIYCFGSFFNQRNNVAHTQNTIGNAARMEFFQRFHFFAGCNGLDRLAGHGTH